jgi:membrane protein implicated in regulation of membrane protease activity
MRGRTVVALLLGGFVLVALAIVWRRTIGIGQSDNLTTLESRKIQLEGERVRLESEIREASGRRRLGETVETRLGMRIPADNQVVILPRRANGSP